MSVRKKALFSKIAMIGLILFICGIGSFNQLTVFKSYRLPMFEMILCFLGMICSVVVEQKGKIYRVGIFRWFFPLFVVFMSIIFGGTVKGNYIIYLCIIIFFIQCGVNAKIDFKWIMNVMSIFGIIVALSVIGDYFFENVSRQWYALYSSDISFVLNRLRANGYMSGITIQPAYASLYIAAAFGTLICFSNLANSVKRCLIVMLYISLLLTGKRMISMAVLICVAVIYLVQNGNSKSRISKLIKVLLLIFGVYIAISTYAQITSESNGITRLFGTFENIFAGKNILNQRADLWKLSMEIFYSKPIFGAGWGTVSSLTENMSSSAASLTTHNIYIQLLAETGVVGAVLFMSPFVLELYENLSVLSKVEMSSEKKKYLSFAVFWQTLFIIYGFTGNPIYDLCPLCIFAVATVMGKKVRYDRI